MTQERAQSTSSVAPLVLALPFTGRWLVQNSPANRVPSHGTPAFGSAHAIDFVPVDSRGRSAPRTWRSLVAAEPPENFTGFGRPILAPISGRIVEIHEDEEDHGARRSPLTLASYMAGQAARARQGAPGLAGNHIVMAVRPEGPFVLLAHMRRGSIRARPGEHVRAGDLLAACGNSGNSTEPHVHVQASDSTEWRHARGVPITFRRPGVEPWLPRNGEIVDV